MANIDASTPQLKVVKKWIDAICSFDTSPLASLISRNFRYQSLPNAVDLPEIRGQGMKPHIQWVEGLKTSMTKFGVIIHEVIEAPGKVVIHATAAASLVDGTTQEYDFVSIFTLVEEDGEIKVLESKDFSDPQKRGAFYAGLAKAAQGATTS